MEVAAVCPRGSGGPAQPTPLDRRSLRHPSIISSWRPERVSVSSVAARAISTPLAAALKRAVPSDSTPDRACTHKIAIGDSDLISVRFGSLCELKSDISRGPRSANSCHMRRSKQHLYSITSSARASSVGGTSMPSALAVPRLITSSNFMARSTGMSAGLAPLRMRPA